MIMVKNAALICLIASGNIIQSYGLIPQPPASKAGGRSDTSPVVPNNHSHSHKHPNLPKRTPSHLHSTATPKSSSSNDQTQSSGCTIGDTRGAILLLQSIDVSRGSNPILTDINLRVERNQRWGIVGPNGAGKSTLLNTVTGRVLKDSGVALVAPKTSVGYLRQTAVSGSVRSVYDEAASEMLQIAQAKERLGKAEDVVANSGEGQVSEKALEELDEAGNHFESVGGWTQAQDVDSVLKGLGFEPEDSERLCSEFSGGWQMRIALARLLLSKPNVLLLDEPSNHLDSSARDWLGKYLSSFSGSLILVSHDISLLSTAVNNIAEISSKSLLTYVSCTYDKYLDEKVFRAKAAMAEYERNLAEAERLQDFVDKWGASATKASAAQSRVKMIEKMRKEGKLTPPPQAVVQKVWKPSIMLPDPPKARGEVLLGLYGADVGYGEGAVLLEDVSMDLMRGMKLVLRGPNGAGKSTLVAALRGDLPLMGGERNVNERLRLGSFTQDLAQQLDINARAIDLVTAHAREGVHGDITVSDEDARNVMGRLGLTADKPLRKVGELSGGEKARVALSMFALKASNVLILDEPSNHLDVECIAALSSALSSWGGKDGAIIVVSHDRNFCKEVGFTHVGTVDNGKLTIEQRDLNDGDWSQYDINSKYRATSSSSEDDGLMRQVELTPEEKEERKRRQKKAYNAPKRIKKLEELIEVSEGKMAVIDDEMMKFGSDVGKLTDLQSDKEVEEEMIMEMMAEWEELESLLAEVSS